MSVYSVPPVLIDISSVTESDAPSGIMTPMGLTSVQSYGSLSDSPSPTMTNSSLSDSQTSTPIMSTLPVSGFAPAKKVDIATFKKANLKTYLESPDIDVRKIAVEILEQDIVTMQGRCPNDIVDNLRIGIFQLNPGAISDYLNSTGLYDHNFQDGMGCLIDAMISHEDIIPDIRLRRWITEINQIGEPSAEGIAVKLDYHSHPLYVVKVARDPNSDNLAHEALIGMGALNTLRNRVPTFMHTYGAFMCSPPIMDKEGKIIAWCPAKTKSITYLVLENIEAAVPLSEIVDELSETEFLQIYMQVLNALNIAYKEFGFTHYDLHAGNVLIQILSYPVSIPFYYPNGTMAYLTTRYLARIIDYGMSHIYLQGQHFGRYDLQHLGIDPEQAFPMYDAYKLLLFTYYNSLITSPNYNSMMNHTTSITGVVNTIYDFFREGKTAGQRVQEKDSNPFRDYFQPGQHLKSVTLDTLIAYILSKYSLSFITQEQPPEAFSTICTDTCIDWNTFTQTIFDRARLPRTLEDYCQAHVAIDKLSSKSDRSDLKKWVDSVNIDQLYDTERETMVGELNETIQSMNGVSPYLITDAYFNFAEYQQNLIRLIGIRSRIQNLQIWIAAVVCAFNQQNRMWSINKDMVPIMNGMTEIKTRFRDFQEIIQYNINADDKKELGSVTEIPLLHAILLTNL